MSNKRSGLRTLYFKDNSYYLPRKDYKSITWCPLSNDIWDDPDFLSLNTKQKLVFIYLKTVASKKRSDGYAQTDVDMMQLRTCIDRDLIPILSEIQEKQLITIISRTDYERETFANEMKLNEIKLNEIKLNEIKENDKEPIFSLTPPAIEIGTVFSAEAYKTELGMCFKKISHPDVINAITLRDSFKAALEWAQSESNPIDREYFRECVEVPFFEICPGADFGDSEFCLLYFRMFLANTQAYDFFKHCFDIYLNSKTRDSHKMKFEAFLKSAWWEKSKDKDRNYPKLFKSRSALMPLHVDNIIYNITLKFHESFQIFSAPQEGDSLKKSCPTRSGSDLPARAAPIPADSKAFFEDFQNVIKEIPR